MGNEPTLLVDGLLFPESPRWHAGALWFSDMYARRVCRWDPNTHAVDVILELDDRPSGIGWLPDGRMLVVSMSERLILRLDSTGPAVHADLKPLVTGDVNDMVVGPDGRAYAGNFGAGYAEGRDVEPTNLVIVEPDGEARRGAGNLLFPNGMVLPADGRSLIVAEGFGRRLVEFAVDQGGDLVDPREFGALDDIPDGIAHDVAGGVWVAMPLQQAFVRVEDGGAVTDRIDVGTRGAFACTLGGEDRRTLFLCVAAGTPEEIRSKQSRGQILTVTTKHAGQGWP